MWRTTRRMILVLLALLVVGLIVPTSSTSYDCLACKLHRLDKQVAWISYSQYEPNECSRWVDETFGSSHSHKWLQRTVRTVFDLLGFRRAGSCSPPHPAIFLGSDDQLGFYKHFKDPSEGLKIMLQLLPDDAVNRRASSKQREQAERKIFAILEWKQAHFPGEWDDWWKKWDTEHPPDP